MSSDDPKAPMRRALRARRRMLQSACPQGAQAAAEALADGRLQGVRIASIYHAIGSEIDPEPLAAVLEGRGLGIALPVAVEADAPLIFRLRGAQPMVVDAVGVHAPPDTAETVRPDLVVTPVLAFDSRGGRLGQGGGFYDRTLALLRGEGQVIVLGLAYAGQEVEAVPMGAHDQRLDGVLTEAGLRWFDKDV